MAFPFLRRLTYRLIKQAKKHLLTLATVIILVECGLYATTFNLSRERSSYEDAFMVLAVLLLGVFYLLHGVYKKHALNEAKLRVFIKHTPAAVAMLDREMRYIEVSDRWLQDYHIREEDIIGRRHYDVFPQIRTMPVWLDDHRRCLSGETIRREEDSFIGLNGKLEWLTYELIPWRHEDGTIGGLIFFTEVITPRIEARRKLQESEERYDRAVRGSNDGIWDWDLVNKEIFYSPRFKALLGYREDEIGNTIEDWETLLHPDDHDPTLQKVNDHFTKRVPYIAEYRLRNQSGEYIWFEARGQAEWDEHGNPLRMAGSLTNISDRKRLEQLKTEFVYVVTHELRTPLTALSGALDMLPILLGNDLPTRVARLLDLAMQGCSRLATLVDDLLTAGHVESETMVFNMQNVDARRVVRLSLDLNRPYADKYDVHYVLCDEAPHPDIIADPDRLMQIMANLLSNATKFSPPGHDVTVTMRNADNSLRIAVQDKGEGIPENFRPRIFEKFAQNHTDDQSRKGSGLGLNIAKTLVEKMNGRIWFETETAGQYHGTTFFVDLPLAITKAAAKK